MTAPDRGSAAPDDNTPREGVVGDVLIDWARRTPNRIVLTDIAARQAPCSGPPRSWTCETLRDDAATLAVALLSRYAPGERIALWGLVCPDGVLLQFAAAFAGLVLVRIDPAWRAADLARILEESGSVALFMTSERGRARPGRATAQAPDALREVVDLADRRGLFTKLRRVEGLPEVGAGEPAEIRYTARQAGPPIGRIVLHRELATALRNGHETALCEVPRAMAVA